MEINRHKAILILGPTGSGKTPFGQQLETQHLWGRNYHHFDFGEILRSIAAGNANNRDMEAPHNSSASSGYDSAGEIAEPLSTAEIATIKNVLETNTLLEDKDFVIAEKILKNFIAEKELDPLVDIIILNGLPRQIGQAMAMEAIFDIKIVIHFCAPPSVIYERIKTNVGGDRTGRIDDSIEEVAKKLKIFAEQTEPLLDFYKSLDKTILQIDVDEDTIPLYVIQGLQTMPCLL